MEVDTNSPPLTENFRNRETQNLKEISPTNHFCDIRNLLFVILIGTTLSKHGFFKYIMLLCQY